MHKSFYASGFLYNLKTNQILLLQPKTRDNLASNWSMLGGESKEGEDAQDTFQRIVLEKLNLNIKIKHIYPVYDYIDEASDKVNYVFYAEVKRNLNFDPLEESTLSWVTFQETLKLLFSAQTKQDVVVGGRVIDAKWREDAAIKAYDQEE
ncbi:NUDIX hydrolase [Candidatus Daviesbacteria bacterium]|nr:NUDIX hydrolase [Candidatus Daviesbacteria bacterium]